MHLTDFSSAYVREDNSHETPKHIAPAPKKNCCHKKTLLYVSGAQLLPDCSCNMQADVNCHKVNQAVYHL